MSKLPWHAKESTSSFLPGSYVQGKQNLRFATITVSLFVIVMFAVVGAFLVTNQRWSSVRSQQESIETAYSAVSTKLEQLKTLEAQRTEMVEKAGITTTLIETAPRSVLLAEITTALPEAATLLSIELESKRIKMSPVVEAKKAAMKAKSKSKSKSKVKSTDAPKAKPKVLPPSYKYTLTVTGVAPTNNEVADYLHKLQESPLLEKVELVYIDETKIDDLELRQFEIVANLPKDADARKIDIAEEFDLDLASVLPAEEAQ